MVLREHIRTVIITVIMLGALALVAAACGEATTSAERGRADGASALRLTQAPIPRFRVPKYDTQGTYVQVEGAGDLSQVNAALRRIVTDDQRAYAPAARRAARQAGRQARGAYETFVHTNLVSASTAVVSVLMPAIHLFPGGTQGGDMVSGTVLVPSGRRVSVNQLFTHPAKALPVLAREFRRAYRRQHPSIAACLENVPLRPAARYYGHVALLPGGLAVGSGAAVCTWVIATIPYGRLSPYFSPLARELIHDVRRPAPAP